MSITRRSLFLSSIGAAMTGLVARASGGAPATRQRPRVVTPNGGPSLPYKMVNGVKEFRLVAEPVRREFMEGFNVWFFLGSLGSMGQYTVTEIGNTHRKILGQFFLKTPIISCKQI